jgi:hypothetical protein
MPDVRTATTSTTQAVPPPSAASLWVAPCRASSTPSLEKKPTVGTMPARAANPIVIVQKVTGRDFRSPPIADSALLPTACIATPQPRKSSALNAPCDTRWVMPASAALAARAANIRASWLTVDQARARLRSVCATANDAASSIVTAATTASVVIATCDVSYTGSSRASR